MINKIEIDNFRLFKHFEMDGIKRINLIAGNNNVGKSTLLEAISLYCDNDVNHLIHIRMRDELPVSLYIGQEIDLQNLFYLLEYSIPIKIALNEKLKTFCYKEEPTPPHIFVSDSSRQNVRYIKNLPETKDVCKLFNEVANDDEKLALVIKYLSQIEPRIKDLRLGFNGSPYIIADIGIGKKIILNNLGDGINKLLGIILIMLLNENLILLIDEIENGFYYKFYPKLWEMLGKVAKETNCQIFATTHSYECIEGAKVLNDNDDPDLFGFIRLNRDKDDNIIPTMYTQSMFNTSFENDWEVR
jgi:AAA15 family ATPase/GTPase